MLGNESNRCKNVTLRGGYTSGGQQRPVGGRSNITTDEKTKTEMKEIRGSFTLIDQHQSWVKGLSVCWHDSLGKTTARLHQAAR